MLMWDTRHCVLWGCAYFDSNTLKWTLWVHRLFMKGGQKIKLILFQGTSHPSEPLSSGPGRMIDYPNPNQTFQHGSLIRCDSDLEVVRQKPSTPLCIWLRKNRSIYNGLDSPALWPPTPHLSDRSPHFSVTLHSSHPGLRALWGLSIPLTLLHFPPMMLVTLDVAHSVFITFHVRLSLLTY